MNNILSEILSTTKELAQAGCKNTTALKKHFLAIDKLFKHFNMNNLKELSENKQVHELLDNSKFKDVYKAFLSVNFEQGRYITPTQQLLLIERLIELVPSLNINQILLIVITSTRKGYNDFYPAAELFEPANKGLTEEQQREIFKDVFQTEVLTDSFMSAFKKFYEYKRKDKPEFKYTEVILVKLAYKIREHSLGERIVNNIPRKVVDLGVAIKYLEQTIEKGLKNPSKYGVSVPDMEKEKKHQPNYVKYDLQQPLWVLWAKAKESICSIPAYCDKRSEIEDLFHEVSPVEWDGKRLSLSADSKEKIHKLFEISETAHAVSLQLGKKFTINFIKKEN
jgi:hypothetical protein